jgi:hypothetical protein
MIGVLFFVFFYSLFVFQILAMDLILLVKKTYKEIEEIVGHDTLIYPDYESI